MTAEEFQTALLTWFDRHGRKSLPWQVQPTPYRVWVSEIMLQQTQVSTVIGYFERFVARFPDVENLAAAPEDDVLHLWSGLGYYARARNLHAAARRIRKLGAFPDRLEGLTDLPGIGRSTAGAILSISFGQRQPILDGNVKRVLTRFHAIEGWPGDRRVEQELWQLSDRCTPERRVADYTQAIMDLGATLCTRSRPGCHVCPVQTGCRAFETGRTHHLPAPRPKKKIPTKRRLLLVLTMPKEKSFFLERRPRSGVWGGLWSFPEFESEAELEAWCSRHDVPAPRIRRLAERRHTFSHFHLDYTPMLIVLENPMNLVMEGSRALWYKRALDARYGLPAPVGRLIDEITDNRIYEE